jgi:hypothetical protein
LRWKYLALVLVFLICMSTALAVVKESTIIINPIEDRVALGESALFELVISNNAKTRQKYSIFSLQSRGWNVDPQPLSDKIVILDPGRLYKTKVRAQAIDDFPPGIYSVALSIDSSLGEHHEKFLKVYLGPREPKQYLPTIRAEIDVIDRINPRDSVAATLFLQNLNALDLSELTVTIQSSVPEFNQEIPVELLPLDQKTIEFTLTPSEHLQPKKYKLFFVFEHQGETIKVIEKEIEVLTLLPEFVVEVDERSVFFKKLSKAIITNEGNVLNTQEARIPMSFFSSLFTNSDGVFKTYDGQRYLVWEKALRPGEVVEVEFVTNYRLIFYVVLIVLVLSIFYAVVQAPVVLKKKAVIVESSEDGALSEIKVTLELRNRSKKLLKDLEIIDVVPAIANVEKSLELGTMKPKEIRHGKRGTKVIWGLPEFDVHEHRIITYNIRAKLNILGTFKLSRAEVKYAKKNEKHGKAYSNVFKLGG